MPIDPSQVISPFDESLPPELPDLPKQSLEAQLISPFDIAQEAEKIAEKRPDIGPVEEIEGMLTLGTSLIATPISGLAGLSQIISNELGIGEKIPVVKQMEWIASKLTYSPRTEGGQEYAETLAYPFEKIEEVAQYVGDAVFDFTGNPALATDAKVATMFAVPTALNVAIKPVKFGYKQTKSFVVFLAESANMLRPKSRAKFSKEAVGRSLKENIGDSPEVMANIAESSLLSSEITGFNPTLAETTMKPGMIVRERNLAEQSQQTFDIAKSRRNANVRAIEDYRLNNFGDSSPEITAILKRSEGNISKALTALDERLKKIQYDREILADKSPRMELDKVGESLRKLEKEEYLAAKAVGDMLYKRIGNEKVDPSPIINEIDGMFKNDLLDFSQDQIPTSFRLIQRTLRPPKDKSAQPAKTMREFQLKQAEGVSTVEISFDTLRSLEKKLKRDLAKESGKMGKDPTTISLITKVLKRVDEVKSNLEASGGADVVSALREANSFWKEGIVDRFYKGAGRDIYSKTPFNEYRIVDEKVIDSFFTTATKSKGGVKGLDDFINTYGMNSEAWVQLRLGIYQKFRKESGVELNGVIDTKKANIFLNKYSSIFDKIPSIRNELTGLTKASAELDFAQQLIKKRETNISNSILSKALKDNSPDVIVSKSIKENPNDMVVLRTQARKVKGGEQSLAREVGRQLLIKAERLDGTINSAKLLHEMGRNKNSLKIGMTPYHYGLLENLHKAYLRIDKNILPHGIKDPKVGLEKIGETFGTTPAQAISAWRAKSRGLVGGPHLMAQLGTSFITKINKNQINSIERIAHYDKNVAQTLMMMSKAKDFTPKIQNRILEHLSDYGLVNLSAAEGNN